MQKAAKLLHLPTPEPHSSYRIAKGVFRSMNHRFYFCSLPALVRMMVFFIIPPPTILKKNLPKILSSSFSSKCVALKKKKQNKTKNCYWLKKILLCQGSGYYRLLVKFIIDLPWPGVFGNLNAFVKANSTKQCKWMRKKGNLNREEPSSVIFYEPGISRTTCEVGI